MLKAILFDLDGTLLNTIADINCALNKTLGTSFTTDDCSRFVGNGLMNALKAALSTIGKTDVSAPALFEQFVANYRSCPVKYTKPYPGIVELLEELQHKGIGLGVYSNKEQVLTGTIVRTCLPSVKFDMVVGMHGGYEPKPSSQAIEAFCAKVGCSMDELLYVGDSEVDYRTGMNANVATAILTWGFRSKENLLGSGVPESLFVDDIQGLRNRIETF